MVVIIEILQHASKKNQLFKMDKSQQHTLIKFLKNICTIEEDEQQSLVNNNVEPIITDTDGSPTTIDLEDGISIEEINKESNTQDKRHKMNS